MGLRHYVPSLLSRSKGTFVPKRRPRCLVLEELEGRLVLNYPLTAIPELHSDPAASAKLFLDFDGHFESTWGGWFDPVFGTHWGGFENVRTPAFDTDGDRTTFSDGELAAIREIWARCAEDYAPFNVDVTTVDPGNFADRAGLRIAIGGSWRDWYGTQSWGETMFGSYTDPSQVNTGYVFSDELSGDPWLIGDAAAHEAGHAYGLAHQSTFNAAGDKTEEYSSNGGSTVVAPIMGDFMDAPRSLWWQGLNHDGNWQDDMAVIGSANNGFGYRADDHGDTFASASPMALGGAGWSASGIIERTTDRDVFRVFTGGRITVRVNPAALGPDLDATVSLFDSAGNLIASADPNAIDRGELSAELTATVTPGTYYVVVGSHGDYGDVGQYTVSVLADTTPPTSSVAALPALSPLTFTLSWDGSDDVGGAGIASYDVFVSDNGGTYAPLLTGTTQTSTAFTGVNGHAYGFYSLATDGAGNRQAAPFFAQARTQTLTDLGPPEVTTSGPAIGVPALPRTFAPAFPSPTPPTLVTDTATSSTQPAERIFVTGADAGGGPNVVIFDAATHQQLASFFAYEPSFLGGVRVAMGDVNGDGTPDIIVAPGPGRSPEVTVYDGTTFNELFRFFAFPAGFTGGVWVSTGDVNADGFADIICGADKGGGPNISVYSGKSQAKTMLCSFFAYDPGFSGGVRIAAGDINGDGHADVVCGAGPGGGPNITVFDGRDAHLLASFFAFAPSFSNGVYVAAGDVTGGGKADVIVGAGAGGGPNVTVFDGQRMMLLSFFPYDLAFTGGVRVASIIGSNGQPAILSVAGPGGGPDVRVFTATGQTLDAFFAYDPKFTGGIYIAG